MENRPLGQHWLLELNGCPSELSDDLEFVSESVVEAARIANSTLLGIKNHKFEPQGVTVVGLLAESHLSIHTWPEADYVGADIFTCGEDMAADKACDYLVERFRAESHSLIVVSRGTGMLSSESIQIMDSHPTKAANKRHKGNH